MQIDFQNIINQLKTGIAAIAKASFSKRITEITKEGNNMLVLMKDDVERWTNQLAAGDLSEDDFKDLVLGQKDIIEITALKQLGLTKIQADQFKQQVLNLVIDVVVKSI